MEVVGVIAAVPGLIDIIKRSSSVVQAIASKHRFIREAEQIVDSLKTLKRTLTAIEEHLGHVPIIRVQHDELFSLLSKHRKEVETLCTEIESFRSKNNGPKLSKRIWIGLTRYNKELKIYPDRLGRLESELHHILTQCIDLNVKEIASRACRDRLQRALQPCQHGFIDQRTVDTCQWIWDQLAFTQWANAMPSPSSPLERVLCMHGPKGCGKSVLARSIAEQLNQRGKRGVFFPFWSSSNNQQKMVHLLRTVLWHLLSDDQCEAAHGIATRMLGSLTLNEDLLCSGIKEALKNIDSDVYLVIDGIDEASEDWNNRDGPLRIITDFVKAQPNLRILLVGREPSMRLLLNNVPRSVKITGDLVEDDIRRFIDKFITERSQSCPEIFDESRCNSVRDSLQKWSEMMFLPVAFKCKELEQCASSGEIQRSLDQVPRNLDRSYHDMLAKLMKRSDGSSSRPSISMGRAKGLLSIVLAAPEPLTFDELNYAYAVQVRHCRDPQGVIPNLEDDLLHKDGIMDSCGDFIRTSDGLYYMTHASATDFLTRSEAEWQKEDQDISFFRIDLGEAQASMGVACLGYLESLDLGYPLTDDSRVPLQEKYRWLSYSSIFMPFHITEGSSGTQCSLLEGRLRSFLASAQFCALVEYLVLSALEESMASVSCYLLPVLQRNPIFHGAIDLQSLTRAFKTELQRRKEVFGEKDARYQSWKFVLSSMNMSTDQSNVTHIHPSSTSSTALNDFKYTPLVRATGPLLLRSKSLILDWIIPKLTIRLNVLPVPFLTYLGHYMCLSSSNKRGLRLLFKVLELNKHRSDFYTSLALHDLYLHGDTLPHQKSVEILRESLNISIDLPASFFHEMLVQNTLIELSDELYMNGDGEDEEEALDLEMQATVRSEQTPIFAFIPWLPEKLIRRLMLLEWGAFTKLYV